MTVSQIVHSLFIEAIEEDRRENGQFDVDGFSNFFPEQKPEDVAEAWRLYDAHHARRGTWVKAQRYSD